MRGPAHDYKIPYCIIISGGVALGNIADDSGNLPQFQPRERRPVETDFPLLREQQICNTVERVDFAPLRLPPE